MGARACPLHELVQRWRLERYPGAASAIDSGIGIRRGESRAMKLAMIGSGYVGLVAATCLAEIGHDVVCADNDPAKIEALSAGDPLIHEEFLPELLARHRGGRLRFTTSL